MAIAIVGINGFLGKAFLETFKDPKYNKEDLIVVSRDVSKLTDSENVKHYNFSDLDKVVQVASTLIVLGGANPDAYNHVYDVLAKPNNVKIYVPSTFGFLDSAVDPYLPGFFDARPEHIDAVRKLGIKTITNNPGFFAVPNSFLYEFGVDAVGLYPQTGELKIIGDIEAPLAVSSPHDIARSVAEALKLDEIPDDLIYYSDVVSPKKIVDRYLKNHPDFEIKKRTTVSYDDAVAQARETIAKGFDFQKELFSLLHVVIAGGTDKGFAYSKSHREQVNPNESKWKWFNFDKEQ